MNKPRLAAGTAHSIVPNDLAGALTTDKSAFSAWNDITPLARNEWICWVEEPKLAETRARRVERTWKELAEGKRRPCCWIGCTHRTDKAISPSVQGILNSRIKKSS